MHVVTTDVAKTAVVLVASASALACTSQEEVPSPQPASTQQAIAGDAPACTPLSAEEVAVLLGPDGARWKGEGSFTPTAAERAPLSGDNEFFSGVIYLQGDTSEDAGQVYVFATTSDDLTVADGGLLGADPLTRDRWAWGDVAQRGAPLTTAARDAVADAPACLP